jgi:hypothetical protein
MNCPVEVLRPRSDSPEQSGVSALADGEHVMGKGEDGDVVMYMTTAGHDGRR